MENSLRFDGRVAVITGAGGGLGRCYALDFAKRGCKVVVNDLGGSHTGEGKSKAADVVVDEIRKGGGEAVSNYDSVENGESIIGTAISNYGRVDILVNNAGILRDVSMAKMTEKDWDLIMLVHLKGSWACTKAAWPYMQKQKYGRIINTASAAGLYGNYGQANYGAAKLGLLGFTNTLAIEGVKYNIQANCIVPLAASRLTATVMPGELMEKLSPTAVAPLVIYLCNEKCKETGQILEVGAGWIAKVRHQRAQGVKFEMPFTAEQVEKGITTAMDFSNPSYPTNINESLTAAISAESNLSVFGSKGGGAAAVAQSQWKSSKLFQLMTALLQHKPDQKAKLISSVGAIFEFIILDKKGGKAVDFWVVDLRNGVVKNEKSGEGTPPDATFSISDADIFEVVMGKLNPQIAFVQGKMQIRGSMKAAMKFTPSLFPPMTDELLTMSLEDAIKKYTDGGAATRNSTPSGPDVSLLKAGPVLEFMQNHIKSAGDDLCDKVKFVYQFDILPKKGAEPISFIVDLKNKPGKIQAGKPDSFDAKFTMEDTDFVSVVTGKLNPQVAFVQGKMKIKGDMRAAMKFTPNLFPTPANL
eukprot:Filipodium_phascolosomae@DN2849_c0_g1_i1.p1